MRKNIRRLFRTALLLTLLLSLMTAMGTTLYADDGSTDPTTSGSTEVVNSDAEPLTGWQTIDGKKYYYNNDGKVKTGIFKVGGAIYYASSTGQVKTSRGFVSTGGKRYYVQSGGKIITGKSFKVDGKTYAASSNGALKTGVYKWGKRYYYSNKYGAVRKKVGMITVNGVKRYVTKGGPLKQNGFVRSGKYYYYMTKYAKPKLKPFKRNGYTLKPNRRTGAISVKQYNRSKYGPYPYSKYVLIDISSQTLKYYVNGKVKMSSKVVTGNVAGHTTTPTGKFVLRGKSRNVNLTGANYVSHVDYWMPFIGQSYGMHDASWRSSFGGSIYRYNGSHGCVNMPRANAAKLYSMISVGTKVIIRK